MKTRQLVIVAILSISASTVWAEGNSTNSGVRYVKAPRFVRPLIEKWISEYKGKLLVIDGDTVKFADNPEDFRYITDRIDAELFGLFPFEAQTGVGKEV